jgi:hypothetical protein
VLTKALVVAACVGLAFEACSDPDAYPGGGRYQTLPGQTGDTLVPVDAGAGQEAAAPPVSVFDASDGM